LIIIPEYFCQLFLVKNKALLTANRADRPNPGQMFDLSIKKITFSNPKASLILNFRKFFY